MLISSPSEGLTSNEAFLFQFIRVKDDNILQELLTFPSFVSECPSCQEHADVATSSINKDFSGNHHRCTVEMCCWWKGLPGDRVPCGSVCVLVHRGEQICESRYDPGRFSSGGDKRPVLLWSIYFLLLCIKHLFLLVFSVFQAGRCRIPLWPLGWWWASGGCSLSSSSPRTRPTSQPSSPSHA